MIETDKYPIHGKTLARLRKAVIDCSVFRHGQPEYYILNAILEMVDGLNDLKWKAEHVTTKETEV